MHKCSLPQLVLSRTEISGGYVIGMGGIISLSPMHLLLRLSCQLPSNKDGRGVQDSEQSILSTETHSTVPFKTTNTTLMAALGVR
jgi:hypothetical protein